MIIYLPITTLYKFVILATLSKERLRQINFPVNFVQFFKMLFIDHFWVAASAPCKDFVILQISAISTNLRSFFLCYPCIFVILAFLALVNVLKQTFNIRKFPKNTAHIEVVV